MPAEAFEYTTSTGNVFADLGLPDAAVRFAHTQLTLLLAKVERRPPPERPERERSLDELVRAIARRGYDVRIELQRRTRVRTVRS